MMVVGGQIISVYQDVVNSLDMTTQWKRGRVKVT